MLRHASEINTSVGSNANWEKSEKAPRAIFLSLAVLRAIYREPRASIRASIQALTSDSSHADARTLIFTGVGKVPRAASRYK